MLGIGFALGASFCWTYACYLWRQQVGNFSAIQVNLFKNLIAFLVFIPILFTLDYQLYSIEILILMLSGILGKRSGFEGKGSENFSKEFSNNITKKNITY